MLNKEWIKNELDEVMETASNYRDLEKLTYLITVLNFINKDKTSDTIIDDYSHKSYVEPEDEFSEIINYVSTDDLIKVFKEYANKVKVIHPNVYEEIINDLKKHSIRKEK